VTPFSFTRMREAQFLIAGKLILAGKNDPYKNNLNF
jgi:hypothetical protein